MSIEVIVVKFLTVVNYLVLFKCFLFETDKPERVEVNLQVQVRWKAPEY